MNTWSQRQQKLHESSDNRLYECKPAKICVHPALVNLKVGEKNMQQTYVQNRTRLAKVALCETSLEI